MFIELLLQTAWAGSCCAGTTTALPTRVGEREHVAIVFAADAEHTVARWDDKGRLLPASPVDRSATATVGVGWRLSHAVQVNLSVPVQWTSRTAGGTTDAGGGLGDLAVGAVFDPFVEGPRAPMPVFWVGLRTPTGRDWTESGSPLLADVTGETGPSFQAGAALERQYGDTPWSAGIDLDAGLHRPVALALSGTAGRALGSNWTLVGGLRHVATLAGEGTNRTTLSAQVVRGESLAWRAWGGLAVDVPLPGLGRHQTLGATASLGVAWVR